MEIILGEQKDLPIREAVRGIVFKEDKVGVVKLKTFDFYMFPGGGIDAGESHETAIQREMMEETGLNVTVRGKLLTTTSFGETTKHINHIYVCDVVSEGNSVFLTEEEEWLGLEFEWIGLRELYTYYVQLRFDIYSGKMLHVLDEIIKREFLILTKLLRDRSDYRDYLRTWIGSIVDVSIDRPISETQPTNYGYIEKFYSLDSEKLDAYVLDDSGSTYRGKVIAVIHRKNDIEDKLVVANEYYSVDDIKSRVLFQEQYFDFEIIVKDDSDGSD